MNTEGYIRYPLEYQAPNCDVDYANGNYNYVFSPSANRQLSVLEEPNVKYSPVINYLHVTSADRDSTNYPLHYDYKVNFNTYKNVKSVELVSAIFPNQPASSSGGNILNEPYLLIDISELNYIDFPIKSAVTSIASVFSVYPLKNSTQSSGGYIFTDFSTINNTKRFFKIPSNLSVFHIKIRDMNGNLYDFGQTAGSTNKAYQHSLTFKIISEEVDRKQMNVRNVY